VTGNPSCIKDGYRIFSLPFATELEGNGNQAKQGLKSNRSGLIERTLEGSFGP
jgi:hypothetical protein